MSRRLALSPVVVGLTLGLLGSGARALPEGPPEIVVIEAERAVNVAAQADGESDNHDVDYLGVGPFVELVQGSSTGPDGSRAWAEAWQRTDISTYSIRGKGAGSASASLGGGEEAEVLAIPESWLRVTFQVTESGPFSLHVNFAAEESPTTDFSPSGYVTFAGYTTRADGSRGADLFSYSHTYTAGGTEPATFDVSGAVEPGWVLLIGIALYVDREGELNAPWNFLGDASASYDFVLDFGDRDGDGLLDLWEEEGIDFTGPGIEIDLPGMGADPDHKDLFIEIDRMEGVPLDLNALNIVGHAFADAPANMVDNPDGTKGINLHLVYDDGDVVPLSSFVAGGAPDLWQEFDDLKDEYFGSQDLRDHPERDAIRLARDRIFRYCLWGDTYVGENGSLGGGEARHIPGSGFVLAAGSTGDTLSSVQTKALAGLFMHELGHALGLRHGGQDEVQYKPNYLSVMNYAYSFPFDEVNAMIARLNTFWRADYSRATMRTLAERQLVEEAGLDGPAGRWVIFNSAAFDAEPPVRRTFDWARAAVFDWDADNEVDTEAYKRDLNRLSPEGDPHYEAILRSYSDWDRLVYPVPVGLPAPAARGPAPAAPDLDLVELAAFAEGPWVDLTANSDLIFEDDFEAATTNAWSATKP